MPSFRSEIGCFVGWMLAPLHFIYFLSSFFYPIVPTLANIGNPTGELVVIDYHISYTAIPI